MFSIDIITPDFLFSAATLVFITAAFVCGVIRWKHICHPCEANPDYYYPARKPTAVFYCASILWLPYVLSSFDPGVWVYTRILGIIYYPVGFALVVRRYFGLRNQSQKVLWTVYLVVPAALMLSMCFSLFVGGAQWIAEHSFAVLLCGGIFGAFLTAIMVVVMIRLRHKMEYYNTDNYSDDEDFPYGFAKMICYAAIGWMAMIWIIFFCDNHWVNFAGDIISTVVMVELLCVILHPQKSIVQLNQSLSAPAAVSASVTAPAVGGNTDGTGIPLAAAHIAAMSSTHSDAMPDCGLDEGVDLLDDAAWREALDSDVDTSSEEYLRVKELVLGVVRRRFREPHLLKSDVLMEIGSGDICRASRFIASVGYYNLVNMFRLEYARLYKAKHPRAKQDEIAVEAGFSSRTSYYKAKKRVGEVDYSLVSGVEL